jgi:UDP-GlcNAc:undecaprenyl-phosphate GlcNAc-1-phosphate transferase
VALTYCLTFVVSLLAGFLVTRQVRNFAVRHGIAVGDTRDRDVHQLPVPRVGGAAIFVAFALIVAAVLLVQRMTHVAEIVPVDVVLRIVFPATLVFALGLYDDLFSASPWLKLGVQALAVVPIYMSGLRVVSIPVLAGHHNFNAVVSFGATLLWILLITNAFNLVDGLDGLAAGSALFSTLIMFVMALVNSHTGVAILALTLVGAITGFLRFNFSPATIFLGDSGSLLIGFLLSVFALATQSKSSTMLAVAIPIISFGLPIMETGLSVVRRFLSGQPVFRADRQHIHHKLLERGFTQREAVLILYVVSAGCALLSALLLYPGGPKVGVVLFVLGCGIWIGVQHLRYPEMFELGRVARRTIQQKQVIINNLAIRRATQQIRNVSDMDQLYEALRQAFHNNAFDGFELRPATQRGTMLAWRSEVFFRWERPTVLRDIAGSAHWAMALELMTGAGRNCGEFVLYRRSRGEPLQLDINLITDEFQAELGRALERIFAGEFHAAAATARAAAVGDALGSAPGANL